MSDFDSIYGEGKKIGRLFQIEGGKIYVRNYARWI
jgi:hypothetical protein